MSRPRIEPVTSRSPERTLYQLSYRGRCAANEGSDQPGHPPRLIRVFAICMKKSWVLNYPLSPQRRLWSDWVDAQADVSLRWAYRSLCWFCYAVAFLFTEGVASGEDALSLLDNPKTRNLFIDDLLEVMFCHIWTTAGENLSSGFETG